MVIWGLLNETYDGPVFRHTVRYLSRLRELDDTLASSCSAADAGTASSLSARCPTGARLSGSTSGAPKDPGRGHRPQTWAHDPDCAAYVPGAGDVHLYPNLPESASTKHLLPTLAAANQCSSPVGVGSLFDAITALAEPSRHLAGNGGAPMATPGREPRTVYGGALHFRLGAVRSGPGVPLPRGRAGRQRAQPSRGMPA